MLVEREGVIHLQISEKAERAEEIDFTNRHQGNISIQQSEQIQHCTTIQILSLAATQCGTCDVVDRRRASLIDT
jgi:hypothetical protein